MDEAVNHILSLGTVVLMGIAYIGTFFIRRIVETYVPSIQQKAHENEPEVSYETKFAELWNKVILYAIPCVVAASVGFADVPFIYGEDINTMSGKMLYGVFAGFMSGGMFKVFKQMVSNKTGVRLSGAPNPPA